MPTKDYSSFLQAIASLESASGQSLSSIKTTTSPATLLSQASAALNIPEKEIISQLSEKFQVASLTNLVSLSDKEINPQLDRSVLNWVTFDFIIEHYALPLWIENETLAVGLANPFDSPLLESLTKRFGLNIKPILCLEHEIVDVAMLLNKATNERVDLPSLIQRATSILEKLPSPNNKVLLLPTYTIISKILFEAVQSHAKSVILKRADDIVIVEQTLRDNTTQFLASIPETIAEVIRASLELFTGDNSNNTFVFQPDHLKWEINVDTDLKDKTEILRISFSSILAEPISLESLGIPNVAITQLKGTLASDQNILLIAGPTGLLQTNLLYALMRHAESLEKNVVSIEHPIKDSISGTTQICLSNCNSSFFEALNRASQQSPDILVVHQVTSPNEWQKLFSQAAPGHRTIACLPESTIEQVHHQLFQMAVEPSELAEKISGIFFQFQFPALCSACSRSLSLEETEEVSNNMGQLFESLANRDLNLEKQFFSLLDSLKAPTGCVSCNFSGYDGHLPLFSYMPFNSELRQLIRDQAGQNEFKKTAEQTSHPRLIESLVELLESGCVSPISILPTFISTPIVEAPHITKSKNESDSIPENPVVSTEANNQVQRTKILVVDDDEDIRSIVRMVLEKDFFVVEEAYDGFDGLEKVFSDPPDLILCDIAMPRLDGREFVKRVRKEKHIANLPIIMFTAFGEEETEVDLLECGADDFISKTASAQKILARVKRMLR